MTGGEGKIVGNYTNLKISMTLHAFLVCLLAIAYAERTEVKFGYGWRFSYGGTYPGVSGDALDAPGPRGGACLATDFKNITDYTCTNMANNPSRFTPGDCAQACCYDPSCLVWQQADRHCLHGFANSTCTPGKSGNLGGMRTAAKANLPVKTDYTFSSEKLDDSGWTIVNAPHDALFSQEAPFQNQPNVFNGFVNRNFTNWYRKHFVIPSDWEGDRVELHFEGVNHVVSFWLNGMYLGHRGYFEGGYSGFILRLDNVTSLRYGEPNVLALRIDGSFGSEHWYGGAGIYRNVWLHRLSSQVHIVEHGLFVHSNVDVSKGDQIPVSVEVETDGKSAVESVSAVFTMYTMDGKQLTTKTTSQTTVAPASTTILSTNLSSDGIALWSLQDASNLYNITCDIMVENSVMDSHYDDNVGFRIVSFHAQDPPIILNGVPFRFRGFSHHNSFAGVGVAMPPRLDLFRAQQSKALGANVWRMSHNAYRRSTYEILNELGSMIWDEHRDYGPPFYPSWSLQVKRDRSGLPAIVLWGFCNEYECNGGTGSTGNTFRSIAYAIDGTRETAANGDTTGLDVQGFSHASNNSFISFHKQNPNTPLVLSECCSCTTNNQRGDSPRTISSCVPEQNTPGLLPYVTGSLGVWTLTDYAGESHTWPQVSSPYGQFDFAGFPKAHAFWYRANWNARYNGEADKPAVSDIQVARILDLADQVSMLHGASATIHTISSGEEAELFVDGRSQGVKSTASSLPNEVMEVDWMVNRTIPTSCSFPTNLSNVQCHGLQKSSATSASQCQQACCASSSPCSVWQYLDTKGCWIGDVSFSTCDSSTDPWVGGGRGGGSAFSNATLVTRTGGKEVARHTLLAPGNATSIQLVIDVPNPSSGTGSKLLLDGEDVALVRAELVDANGVLVSTKPINITFSIASGPGRIIGVGNGDPSSHCKPSGATCNLYSGVMRGIVQANTDCVSKNRDLLHVIDVDSGKRTSIIPTTQSCPLSPIIIKATAAGFPPATISLETSDNAAVDSPRAAARATNKNIDPGAWIDTFQG